MPAISYPRPLAQSPRRTLAFLPLLSLLILAACARRPVDIAWQRQLDRQPLAFAVPEDSAGIAWTRAEEWMRMNLSGHTVTERWGDSLVAEPDESASPKVRYWVARHRDGDSTRFEVDDHRTVEKLYDILGTAFPDNERRWLAYYTATGRDFDDFERSYVPDSADRALIDAADRAREDRLWLGMSGGPRGVAGEAGFRHDWYGLSLGIAGAGASYPRLPSYSNVYAPADEDTTLERFGSSIRTGINLFGFLDLDDAMSLYGSVGGYVNEATQLVRDQGTGTYYKAYDQTVWIDGVLTAGAGVQLTLVRWLVVGVGYNTLTGWGGQLGYRF